MTVDEIRSEVRRCAELPWGRTKTQRLESASEQARQTGDHGLQADIFYLLIHAYEYGAERENLPIACGSLLRLLDVYPAEVGRLQHQTFWLLKWMTTSLYRNPAVPLETVRKWMDEFENRYRQQGYSPRPVLARRSNLAGHLGDREAQTSYMEQSIAAARDAMADCDACEPSDWGDWRLDLGDDEGALEHWAPVLAGERTCQEEPHWVLSKALLPLLRLGRADEARGAFLRGYPMVRHDISLMGAVGRHIEFCALTGNEARGLEIFTEHASWLGETDVDRSTRLEFVTGLGVLAGRLSALGHDDLPIGKRTAGELK